MRSRILAFLLVGLVVLIGLFLVIQLVPYGRDHTNPAVTQEPNWDSPETRQLAKRACFDCHSNETDWSPWYANVAPASWLVQRDVDEGRRALNFSTWGQGRAGEEADEMGEVVQEGEMPPVQYLLLHADARLSDAEKQQLVQGLYALSQGS